MASYAVEFSRNGVTWEPEAVFSGKLPRVRAEDFVEERERTPESAFARMIRVETGEVMATWYPPSFDLGDVIRDLTN